MKEFLEQSLPWLLGGTGIGSFIGLFIAHGFALKREREGRAFEAKKEAYSKLSNAIYDFSYNVPNATGVDDWKVTKHFKELSKMIGETTLYANKSVAKILGDISVCAGEYIVAMEESRKIYVKTSDVDPMRKQAEEMHTKVTAKFFDVKNRLIAEMKKDLGIK